MVAKGKKKKKKANITKALFKVSLLVVKTGVTYTVGRNFVIRARINKIGVFRLERSNNKLLAK